MKELLLEVFSGFKFLQEICVQSWGSLGFQPDFHLEAVRTLPSVCPLLRTVLSFPSYVWNHEYPENLRKDSGRLPVAFGDVDYFLNIPDAVPASETQPRDVITRWAGQNPNLEDLGAGCIGRQPAPANNV